jgi:hypothetical protein
MIVEKGTHIFGNYLFDGFVKSRFYSGFVIPAKAGIQLNQGVLGSRLRGSDGFLTFYEIILFEFQQLCLVRPRTPKASNHC